MKLSIDIINKALDKERVWEVGKTESFTFGDWKLTLRKEEELYLPYTFSVSGKKNNSSETWRRKYTSLENAFLHILNNFNENVSIENKYKSLSEALLKDKRLKEEAMLMDDYTKQLFDCKIWKYLIESLMDNEQNRGNRRFWTDGNEILCKSEEDASIAADFLNDLGFEDIRTGYYDPEEDERNGEVDERTGYYYIANL